MNNCALTVKAIDVHAKPSCCYTYSFCYGLKFPSLTHPVLNPGNATILLQTEHLKHAYFSTFHA